MRFFRLLQLPLLVFAVALFLGLTQAAHAESEATPPANAGTAASDGSKTPAAVQGDQAQSQPNTSAGGNNHGAASGQHAVSDPAGPPKGAEQKSAEQKGAESKGTQDAKSEKQDAQSEPKDAKADSKSDQQGEADNSSGEPRIVINIDKSTQHMTVFVDGVQKYEWPVSTGRLGYSTPSGTYTPTSMNEIWYSKQWDNAPMPHAIFFMKDGHAIHGSYEVKQLGRPASHGCVRIAPQNATLLYGLVKDIGMKNTQVVLSGVTPGGEAKVAQQPSGERYADERYGDQPWFQQPGQGYYPQQPQRRGGFFGRLFGGPQPYYDGPQGYYYRR